MEAKAVFLLALALSSSPLAAQAVSTGEPGKTAISQATTTLPSGRMNGEVKIRDAIYRYQAEVGEQLLADHAGAAFATMSYTSYVVPDRSGPTRPVTFLFNGGPLVATIALREGVGPVRTVPGEERGTYRYEANTDSLLDQTDLVFIDAPGTGYGRFLTDDAKSKSWGVQQDRNTFASFIVDWLQIHRRDQSPVYLMGESYGGLRAALLAPLLANKVRLRGVTLVSPGYSAGQIGLYGGIDPAVISLPTQAAVARFHGRGDYLNLSIAEVAAKSQAFAIGRYAAALKMGNRLPASAARMIAKEIAGFTGIPADAIVQSNLRIEQFGDSLIAGERVGREDGRAHAQLSEVKTLPPPFDQPDSTMYRDSYDRVAAVDSSFRYGFRYRPKGPFVYLSLEANKQWDWTVPGGSIYAAEELKRTIDRSPDLRVFLMAGYFDAATPFGGSLAAYTAAKLPNGRLTQRAYEAGHAIFSDDKARAAATDDLRLWYKMSGER